MADVVAIEHVSLPAQVEKLPLQFGGDGGLAGAGQAGHPDDVTAVAIAQLTLLRRDLAPAPIDIVALGIGVVSPARIIICAAFGITGGASGPDSPRLSCRVDSGVSMDCARQTIRNAGWPWRRIGSRRARYRRNSSNGSR